MPGCELCPAFPAGVPPCAYPNNEEAGARYSKYVDGQRNNSSGSCNYERDCCPFGYVYCVASSISLGDGAHSVVGPKHCRSCCS